MLWNVLLCTFATSSHSVLLWAMNSGCILILVIYMYIHIFFLCMWGGGGMIFFFLNGCVIRMSELDKCGSDLKLVFVWKALSQWLCIPSSLSKKNHLGEGRTNFGLWRWVAMRDHSEESVPKVQIGGWGVGMSGLSLLAVCRLRTIKGESAK